MDAMPLYTYIASYKGGTHIDQDRRSNFKGFASLLVGKWPSSCLPGFAAIQKEAVDKIARAEWISVPNQTHIWTAEIDLNGYPFKLHAVQTAA